MPIDRFANMEEKLWILEDLNMMYIRQIALSLQVIGLVTFTVCSVVVPDSSLHVCCVVSYNSVKSKKILGSAMCNFVAARLFSPFSPILFTERKPGVMNTCVAFVLQGYL